MKLLQNHKYAARAKYGYCRASETVPYVNNIVLNTYHYMELIGSKQVDSTSKKMTNMLKKQKKQNKSRK